MNFAGRRVRTMLVTVVAVFGLSRAPALAQDTPTAEEIVARSKVAAGGERRPEAERESWMVHLADLEGTLDTVRRGNDVATETVLGPFRTAHGTVRGEKWHQNENGETILERAEPSQTERTLSQTVGRVREPVDAWEIVTTYASGHLMRSYYDVRTYQLVRTERVVAGHETHTTFEDFRTDARGRTRPWHYFGGDDRPDNDFDFRLTRDELDPEISEADVALPHDRRTFVEFPAGVDSVRLPVRIVAGRIYVRVTIAGRGLDFLLDTGSSAITINDAVARDLGLTVYGRSTQTVAGTFATGRVVVPAMTLGQLEMHDVVMRTVPFAASEAKSVRVVGLLGYDFLAGVALRIDYGAGEIEADRPGTLAAPPGAAALDVRFNTGTPVVHATIGGASGDDFIIDTGAAFSYVVFQRFAKAHPDAVEASTRESYGNGVGGTFGYRAIEAKRIVLGPWTLDDANGVEALAANAFGFDNEDGLIGADILKRFTVYLDYAGNHVYLATTPRSGAEATNARR